MIQLEYGPIWFQLPTMVIDAISFLVVLAIALIGLKYYKIDKDRKSYLHLSWAFFLIAAAILFKVLNNIPVYYSMFLDHAESLGVVTEVVESVRGFNLFANVSFSLFVLLNLLGLYVLYNLYDPVRNKRMKFIGVYFILLLAYFTELPYYVYHLTSFIFLFFITSMFVKKCTVTSNKNTKKLAYGFGSLAVSSAIFMFILVHPGIYVLAELIQLGGYILLLSALLGILKYGKKKNKD